MNWFIKEAVLLCARRVSQPTQRAANYTARSNIEVRQNLSSPGSESGTPRGASSSSGSKGVPARAAAIIVVPSAITASVNLWNVGQLLREKKWISPVEIKAAGGTKPAIIKIEHT